MCLVYPLPSPTWLWHQYLRQWQLRNYHTVIYLALRRNHLDVVELILVEDRAYQHGRTGKNINLKPLIYVAAEQGYKDMVKLLRETYEAGNSLGHKGQTALQAAIIAQIKKVG